MLITISTGLKTQFSRPHQKSYRKLNKLNTHLRYLGPANARSKICIAPQKRSRHFSKAGRKEEREIGAFKNTFRTFHRPVAFIASDAFSTRLSDLICLLNGHTYVRALTLH